MLKLSRFFAALFLGAVLCNCVPSANQHLLHYVDPLIGTDAHGHTFPGATTPFGMVQLSPSNDFKTWDWCSGYHYSDSILKGFAHTHISGAGLAGLGDILFMPTTGPVKVIPGTEEDPDSGFRSRFSHKKEKASPGYYFVHLKDYDIDVELTATPRVGFHRYTFHKGGPSNIIIDPTHRIMETLYGTEIEIVSDHEIKGYKHCDGEAGNRKVYFHATFSKPFGKAGIAVNNNTLNNKKKATSKNTKAFASFNIKKGEQIEVKVGISFVSYEGALSNLENEANSLTFAQTQKQAEEQWAKKLSKVSLDKATEKQKRIFYTGLYHSFISPNLISDSNGSYVVENKKYKSNIDQYSNFSTWDTYRALHPLYTLIEQEKTASFVNSMASRNTESKVGLPKWEALGHDNVCMIGYSSVAVMSEAIIKDIPGIRKEEAYQAMRAAAFSTQKHSPNYDVNGMEDYLNYGFVTGETGASVSKTTENNYHDWTLSQVASKMGKTEDADLFLKRSLAYRNLFDPSSGYLLPLLSTGEKIQMNRTIWDGLIRNYVSGNIWGYSTYTPHDMPGIIKLHGGPEKYAAFLDHIFADTTSLKGHLHVDISGFIGKYGHGDEPSQHMPYLYAYVGQPWKTQELVHEVMKTQYMDTPDGLINNEDLGQMSAWYLFSSMGFYPVAPASGKYVFGSPLHKEITLHLENGNSFTVKAPKASEKNIYVQSIKLNGQTYEKTYLLHADIMKGGILKFEMGPTPNKSFNTAPDSWPEIIETGKKTEIIQKACYAPIDTNPTRFFKGKRVVTLKTQSPNAQIHYTIDGTLPDEGSKLYQGPFTISKNTVIKAKTFSEDLNPSRLFEKEYFSTIMADLKKSFPKVNISPTPKRYGASDGSQLIDQKMGSLSFSDGKWTGLTGKDMEIIIDLGETIPISNILSHTLTDTYVWIFPPNTIEILIGKDTKTFKKVLTKQIAKMEEGHVKEIQTHSFTFPSTRGRYVKVVMKNYGPMPSWHGGSGQLPFLLVDEIILN